MIVNIISESEFFSNKDHGVHTAYLATVAMAKAKGLTVKVNAMSDADVTHIHTIGPFGLFKVVTSKHPVVTAHVIPDSFVGSLKGTSYWLGASKKYLRFFYNKAELVLAVAPHVKEHLEELGVTTRIETLPNALVEKFKKDTEFRKKGRSLLTLPEDAFCAISVGQVQQRKGVGDFIKLAKRFPQATFIWIGGQPFKALTAEDETMNKLLADPPPNFFLKGPFTYNEMPYIYNAADIFLFPSYQENAPMGVIEAAGCGLPAVLRDLPEYRKLYEENYIGCESLTDFETEIKKLLTNKEFYQKQSNESLKLADAFSSDKIGDKLVKYYQSLL